MGRFRNSSGDGPGEAAIDMGPMMDCMFILLIFFIVTTTFVEESGVDVEKSNAAPTAQRDQDKPNVVLTLSSKGDVFCGADNIGMAGVQRAIKSVIQREAEAPVVVQADPAVPAGLLVRVVDEAKLGGAKKVSVMSRRKQT